MAARYVAGTTKSSTLHSMPGQLSEDMCNVYEEIPDVTTGIYVNDEHKYQTIDRANTSLKTTPYAGALIYVNDNREYPVYDKTQ